MSSKNTLQEICQTRGCSMPIYNTQRTGGVEHMPSFTTILTVPQELSLAGHVEFSATDANKKASQKLAAELFLEQYNAYKAANIKTNKTLPCPINQAKIIILVDFDNVPEMADLIVPDQVYVNICVSKIKASSDKEQEKIELCKNKGMVVTVVNSSRQNAVDYHIIYELGKLEIYDIPKLIVSRDKFAETLSDLKPNIFYSYTLDDSQKFMTKYIH